MARQVRRNDVTAVLLADGWHTPDQGTFDLGEYALKRGEVKWVPAHTNGAGFTFQEGGVDVSGPLTSILAVKHT